AYPPPPIPSPALHAALPIYPDQQCGVRRVPDRSRATAFQHQHLGPVQVHPLREPLSVPVVALPPRTPVSREGNEHLRQDPPLERSEEHTSALQSRLALV